jgi:hypothetical protein
MTPHGRLSAWNEGDTAALPPNYCPESLDWQRDLRAVLASCVPALERRCQALAQSIGPKAEVRASFGSRDAMGLSIYPEGMSADVRKFVSVTDGWDAAFAAAEVWVEGRRVPAGWFEIEGAR